MKFASEVQRNMEALGRNTYPGRGIVIGMSPDETRFVQIYWIMGRSENSQNRIFLKEGSVVRTAPWDDSKLEDPSLIIYNCIRSFGEVHIVSNGDQTDTIYEAMGAGRPFGRALYTRSFEPDEPNFTPRISGVVNPEDPFHAYQLAIIKAARNNGQYCTRQVFSYETPIPGVGHCIHTYAEDGDPLPAFEGEPYMVEVGDDREELARSYWELLNDDNKVALLVKTIDAETGESEFTIINKHTAG